MATINPNLTFTEWFAQIDTIHLYFLLDDDGTPGLMPLVQRGLFRKEYEHHIETAFSILFAIYLGIGFDHIDLDAETKEKAVQVLTNIIKSRKEKERISDVRTVALMLVKNPTHTLHNNSNRCVETDYMGYFSSPEVLYMRTNSQNNRYWSDHVASLMMSYYAHTGLVPKNAVAARQIKPIENFAEFKLAVEERIEELNARAASKTESV